MTGKRTLQLGTTEILEDFLPVRRIIISPQVGLEFTAQDLQRSTLPNTVCAHETEDLTGTRRRQAVELETVGRIPMGHLGFKVGGQVDDVDGTERAFLRTDTTSNAQTLRDEGDLGFGGDLNAQLAGTDHRARLLAFLATFLKDHQYF
jgi:hypothetical protein